MSIVTVLSISSIFIRITYFYFYEVCNPERYRVDFGYIIHQVYRLVRYCAIITITDVFISLIFVLFIMLFLSLTFLQQKITKQQYIVIIYVYRAEASEPQVNSRDHLIVVIVVGL